MHLFYIVRHVSTDAIDVVGDQLGLLCADFMHAIMILKFCPHGPLSRQVLSLREHDLHAYGSFMFIQSQAIPETSKQVIMTGCDDK